MDPLSTQHIQIDDHRNNRPMHFHRTLLCYIPFVYMYTLVIINILAHQTNGIHTIAWNVSTSQEFVEALSAIIRNASYSFVYLEGVCDNVSLYDVHVFTTISPPETFTLAVTRLIFTTVYIFA